MKNLDFIPLILIALNVYDEGRNDLKYHKLIWDLLAFYSAFQFLWRLAIIAGYFLAVAFDKSTSLNQIRFADVKRRFRNENVEMQTFPMPIHPATIDQNIKIQRRRRQ
jgi:hypothetical protein